MLQCKRFEDPVVFLKEDYTVLQNVLLGALECKFLFHFTEVSLNLCAFKKTIGSCHCLLLIMTNAVNVSQFYVWFQTCKKLKFENIMFRKQEGRNNWRLFLLLKDTFLNFKALC